MVGVLLVTGGLVAVVYACSRADMDETALKRALAI